MLVVVKSFRLESTFSSFGMDGPLDDSLHVQRMVIGFLFNLGSGCKNRSSSTNRLLERSFSNHLGSVLMSKMLGLPATSSFTKPSFTGLALLPNYGPCGVSRFTSVWFLQFLDALANVAVGCSPAGANVRPVPKL